MSEFNDRIRRLFPSVFADVNANENIFQAFAESLTDNLESHQGVLDNYKENLNILTANNIGCRAWEEFLRIAVRADLTVSERRAILFSRISGSFPTLETIQTTAENFTGNTVSIYEPSVEFPLLCPLASAFVYEVQYSQPTPNSFEDDNMIAALERVHPLHCQLILSPGWSLTDESTVTDDPSISTEILNPFIVGSSTVGGSDIVVDI